MLNKEKQALDEERKELLLQASCFREIIYIIEKLDIQYKEMAIEKLESEASTLADRARFIREDLLK